MRLSPGPGDDLLSQDGPDQRFDFRIPIHNRSEYGALAFSGAIFVSVDEPFDDLAGRRETSTAFPLTTHVEKRSETSVSQPFRAKLRAQPRKHVQEAQRVR
jgi:hypothetical protein